MYKTTSRNSQRRTDRLTIPDLQAAGITGLTDEERRDSLKAALKRLEEQILATPRGAKRRELGIRKQALIDQMREIRPKRKAPGVENFFIEAAREMLTVGQFQLVMKAAVNKLEVMRSHEESQPAADD